MKYMNPRAHTAGKAIAMTINGTIDDPLLMKLPMQYAVAE